MEKGNIIGEEFKQYVFDQIDIRQSLNGSGGQGKSLPRNAQTLNYLNTRNAWVKMASGVALTDKIKDEFLPEGKRGTDRLKSISSDLSSAIPENFFAKYNSTGLAKNFVLFNTLSNLNFEEEESQEFSDYTVRSGIQTTQKSWLDVNSSYGLGGNSMGLQPTPGIIDVSIDCVNRGSIRKATVILKAFNKFQFSIIEMLYLRLGYTMMLEWGWDKYVSEIDGDGKFEIETMGNTLIEKLWFKNQDEKNPPTQTQIISNIEELRGDYQGNYDGFFGKVNNFSWNFNSDGSYDITLNLITVGDVVESLKVNIDAPLLSKEDLKDKQKGLSLADNKLKSSSIYNALEGDTLSQYLSTLIVKYKKESPDSKIIRFSDITKDPSVGGSGAGFYGNDIPPSLEYFITLGDFLDIVKNLVIPKLGEDELLINIDTDSNVNYISCHYNQIPFDPKVCIFTTKYSSVFTDKYPSLDTEAEGHPTDVLDRNLPRKFMEEKGGFVAGKLMNIYLNVDFILKKLNSNTDEKGNLSLYKLVESICSGLNDALGNITNLEPVIKDDKTLVIIDQNPIPQIGRFINEPKSDLSTNRLNNPYLFLSSRNNPLLEVYGYNGSKSNFLKEINFQTKIDNSLASMISIGATAGGSDTKNSDATAFSKWNLGLRDRFTPSITDSDPKIGPEADQKQYLEDARKWAENNITEKRYARRASIVKGWEIEGNNKYIKGYPFGFYHKDLFYYKNYYNTKESAINAYVNKVKEARNLKAKQVYDENKLNELVNGTYAIVLCSVFGREITIIYEGIEKKIYNTGSNYGDLFKNDNLSSKLKKSFNAYINNLSNTKFTKTQDPSGNIGFIPVSFDLTLEGLSGVKIYNKLNIDTRFLPPNYGEALDFLVTKVNHKISNNNWDTILGTISTSNVKENSKSSSSSISSSTPILPSISKYNWLKECPFQNSRSLGGVRVINGQLPDILLKEINDPQKYKGSIQSDNGNIRLYSEIVDKLNSLLALASSQGIILKINSAYRTYDDQLEVINQYGRNVAACPGTSNHGFALAIDLANASCGKLIPGMKEYDWIKENAPKYGFNRLPWGNKGEDWESWHWEYTSISRDTTSLTKQRKSAFEEKKRQEQIETRINLT